MLPRKGLWKKESRIASSGDVVFFAKSMPYQVSSSNFAGKLALAPKNRSDFAYFTVCGHRTTTIASPQGGAWQADSAPHLIRTNSGAFSDAEK
jgi:hypothetical protein